MKIIASVVLVITSLLSIPTQAALIKFDVGPLTGFFTPTTLSGSFVLDTNTQSLLDVNLTANSEVFSSGMPIDNASGFGLQETAFLFTSVSELLFDISGFDRFMPGLALGESVNLSASILQADQFNSVFQNPNPFSPNSNVFQGDIMATRLNEVPVPVGLSFLALAVGGAFMMKKRR